MDLPWLWSLEDWCLRKKWSKERRKLDSQLVDHRTSLWYFSKPKKQKNITRNSLTLMIFVPRIRNSDTYLFGILNWSTFRVPISQKDQLLLLPSPKSAYAFSVQFNDSEGNMSLVQHDDFVLISTIINDMSKSKKTIGTAQDSCSPSGISFMRDDNVLIMGLNGVIQGRNVVVLIRWHEMILVKFHRHSYSWSYDFLEEFHITKDPFITDACNSAIK